MSKLAIGYIHGGSIRSLFMRSIVDFVYRDSHKGRHLLTDNDVIGVHGLYIEQNRDILAKCFLEDTNAEWLLTIDTDISFGRDLPYQMLDCTTAETPVMSALYFGYPTAEHVLLPMWMDKRPNGTHFYVDRLRPGVQRLAAVGMGCCLIHRSVFEALAKVRPNNDWQFFGRDEAVDENGQIIHYGEDVSFCRRVDQLGLGIYGNASLVVNHDKAGIENLASFLKFHRIGSGVANEKGTADRVPVEPGREQDSTSGAKVVDLLTTLDSNPDHKPDVEWDLTTLPLPFPDSTFDELHAYDVLEHLRVQGDWEGFFADFTEYWRILKPEGLICAIVPHWQSPWAWGDPSHKRIINLGSLSFLSQAEYADQVGRTAMSDFRFCYKADFELVWQKVDGDSFLFILKAIKPSRLGSV